MSAMLLMQKWHIGGQYRKPLHKDILMAFLGKMFSHKHESALFSKQH